MILYVLFSFRVFLQLFFGRVHFTGNGFLVFIVSKIVVEAKALLCHGYLKALVGDFRDLGLYWEGMLTDYPDHPAKDHPSSSVGCTLYGC